MPELYKYVGPASIREAALIDPAGVTIRGREDLSGWMQSQSDWDGDILTATFVVLVDGTLRVAPRRSEHVACALGANVRAAGELRLVSDRGARVVACSNQSTGYCPEPSCWAALESALRDAEIPHPGKLTHAYVFRKCPKCGERNLVKEGWFVCALCDADLPGRWNFG